MPIERKQPLKSLHWTVIAANRFERLGYIEDILAFSLEHKDSGHSALAYLNLSEHALTCKQFKLAERLLAEGLAFQQEHGIVNHAELSVLQAQLYMEQGRFQAAHDLAHRVLISEHLTVSARLAALTVFGRTRCRMGEPDGTDLLLQALDGALATGSLQRSVPVYLALVEASWLEEQYAACKCWLSSVAALNPAGMTAWQRGEIEVWRQRSGFRIARGGGTHQPPPYAAELDGDITLASEQWLILGAPFDAGMSLLNVKGRKSGQALVSAIGLFKQIGAHAGVARAAGQLRLEAIKDKRGPYCASRQHPLGLTKRQAQILDLVLDGRSNAEIAGQLCRSLRTVEHHVSALLDKLGASNRMELLRRSHQYSLT